MNANGSNAATVDHSILDFRFIPTAKVGVGNLQNLK